MLHLCSGQELNVQEMAWYLFSFSLFLPRGRKSKSGGLCLSALLTFINAAVNSHQPSWWLCWHLFICLVKYHCHFGVIYIPPVGVFILKKLADLKVGDGKNRVIFLISLPTAITCEFSCLLFCQRDLTTVLSWWEF